MRFDERRLIVSLALVLASVWSSWLWAGSLKPFPIKKPPEVNAKDWESAKGKRQGDEDLRGVGGGWYVGGIDRQWYLVMSGPPRKRFYYKFVGTESREIQGTYHVKDELAHFEGTLKEGQVFPKPRVTKKSKIRFALSFHILKDKVYFNSLVRDDKGRYQYERKWYQNDGGSWLPEELHRLTYETQSQTEKKLTLLATGTLTKWDEDGKKSQSFDVRQVLTYDNQLGKQWYKTQGQPGWAPQLLVPHGGKITKNELPPCYHLQAQYFGQVRGFVFDGPPKW